MTTEPTTTETNTAAANLRELLAALPADALLDVLHGQITTALDETQREGALERGARGTPASFGPPTPCPNRLATRLAPCRALVGDRRDPRESEG
jgi:hypothetical protein